MDAVAEYRKRRQQRLDARFRHDAPEEEGNENSPVRSSHKGGGHGNTRLPFGLCQRYGIKVDHTWSPRDALDALAEKGITPASEFAKRSGGGSTIRTKTGATYQNLKADKQSGGKYTLRGDFTDRTSTGRELKYSNAAFHTFLNKEEMFACLQEHGITKFKDPDTGETVNPKTMKLPKTVAKVGETRYKDLVLGFRTNKDGHPLSRKGFSVTGTDFAGKRTVLRMFDKISEAKEYATKIGCKESDLRTTKDLQKYATPKIG